MIALLALSAGCGTKKKDKGVELPELSWRTGPMSEHIIDRSYCVDACLQKYAELFTIEDYRGYCTNFYKDKQCCDSSAYCSQTPHGYSACPCAAEEKKDQP